MASNYLLQQGIAEYARKTPGKVAVRCGNEQLTYLQLFQ
jgi:hypothetical protein